MSRISIRILPNNLLASISIHTYDNHFPSHKEIWEKVEASGVCAGIDENLVNTLVANEKDVKDHIFARALPAPQSNIRLIWHIGNEKVLDFHQMLEIEKFIPLKFEAVEAGNPICSINQAEMAITDVMGNQLVDLDISQILSVGFNISMSQDKKSLIVEKDGFFHFLHNSLFVDEVYRVLGDLDFTTENINYDGSILVGGDVLSGFKIQSTGNIFIDGVVDDADIISTNGSVVVKGGIFGKNSGRILASRNVQIGFIQDASVSAQGHIDVDRYIINSEVTSGNFVRVSKKEGTIRGGAIYTKNFVEANTLGSINNIATDVRVGSKRFHNSMLEEEDQIILYRQREKLQNEQSEFQNQRDFLQLLKKKIDNFSKERQDELESVLMNIEAIESQMEEIDDILNMDDFAPDTPKHAEIIALDTIHPGVTLGIDEAEEFVEREMGSVAVSKSGIVLMHDFLNQNPEEE